METSENHTLETLHRHMEELSDLKFSLHDHQADYKIHSAELFPINEAMLFLQSKDPNSKSLSKLLLIPSSSVTKIMNIRGEFKTYDAIIIADKVIGKLKAIEGTLASSPEREPIPNPPLSEAPLVHKPTQKETLKAIVWAVNPNNKAIKTKIILISELLDQIMTLIEKTNLPESQQALSAIEKAQLIAVLETVLAVLKAPLVEKGIIEKSISFLRKISKKTVEKKSQEALGKAAEEGADLLKNILEGINWDSIGF